MATSMPTTTTRGRARTTRTIPTGAITRRSMLSLLPLASISGCAWIIYPERRHQRNPGPIEVVPLVVDCLLFIPGIVPGIIALAVDFGTRAIYIPRDQVRRLQPGGVVALRRDPPEHIELRIRDSGSRELTRTRTRIDPDVERHTIAARIPPAEQSLRVDLLADDELVAWAVVTPDLATRSP